MPAIRVTALVLSSALLSACAPNDSYVIYNTAAGFASNDCIHGKSCIVKITVSGSCDDPKNIKVDPDPVLMNKKQAVVTWQLPTGYEFCMDAGDGVYLQPKSGGNFINSGATSDPNGAEESVPEDACRSNWRTFNFNSYKGKGNKDENDGAVLRKNTYHYFLRFTDTSRKVQCSKDPWVRNG